jgi:adrenodoxin-NADP+ reductase
LLTYGASLDRLLNVPGESTLANVFSARSFVNWYNGHPYTSSILSPFLDLSKVDHVTIIGQGNVALDVARILLKPIDELRGTDLPDYALAELSRSRVKRVEIVGRRGPLQLASTTKELREMMALPGVGFEMDQELLKQAQGDLAKSPGMEKARMRKRALSMLAGGSQTPFEGSNKSWSFEFLKSPTALHASDVEPVNRVGSISYDINELVLPERSTGSLDPSDLSARRTGQTTSNPTDLVMKSVGYRSIGLPGLPFDERRGIVLNEEGRVIDQNGQRVRFTASLLTCRAIAESYSMITAHWIIHVRVVS